MQSAFIKVIEVSPCFASTWKKNEEKLNCRKAVMKFHAWNQANQKDSKEVYQLEVITSFDETVREPRILRDARGLTPAVLVPVKDDPESVWVQVRMAGGNSPIPKAAFGLT